MWKMVGTAVQGRSHIKKNIPTQDKFCYRKGNVNIIALADGAGSAKLSHYGAQTVVEKMCDLLTDHFDYIYHLEDMTDAQKFIISNLLEELTNLADLHNENIKEFASTLLCVAVKDENILIFHLGDGEIGAIKSNELVSISSGINGDFANATYFVTSAQAMDKVKIFKSVNNGRFTSFFLLSDGTAESFYSKREKKFSNVIKNICAQSKIISEHEMNEMLKDSFENIVRQKTVDDCSFVAMTYVENSTDFYWSLSRSEKELFIKRASRKKHCSVKKMDRIVESLIEPITLNELFKRLHIKREYIKPTINILLALGIVQRYKQNLYKVTEASK